eukprot:CAMPEP_0185298152 /NCGR_PEP_ID=MMETSP1363-20130426/10359_1 /TAXON_ID=38817 /ORGANISM="Gephyrocapsa oceanica, Strain RCC1303" /LENGTH=50 /DNA_ID=CAMNT_0027894937 /DNA_START=24 /DNA_END=172 /DNA_ORIENTATION=-
MTELTVPAAGASSAAGSFLGVLSSTEASAPLAARMSFTTSFLAPLAALAP